MITNADASEAVFEGRSRSVSNFDDILSISSYDILYWRAPVNILPGNGTLIFHESYVLIGLTSVGDVISNNATYIDTFLLSYSAALNGSFETLNQV